MNVALTSIVECQECGARGLPGRAMFHDDCDSLRAWHQWFADHPDRDVDEENPVLLPVEEIPVVSLSGLAEQVKAELHSDGPETKGLDGPLGEAIANHSGTYSLEFITPEQLAQGIVDWLVGE